jgi:GDP-D-mannose dehydratase
MFARNIPLRNDVITKKSGHKVYHMKIALLTGINGQDGSYLTELLGDSTKSRTELGWAPSCSFNQLVE